MAAEGRYVRHFAGRVVSDNEDESELAAAIAELLEGNADFENLQTIPGIGPRTAAQLVVSIDISEFASHDKLESYCSLAPSTQRSGTSVNYDRGTAAATSRSRTCSYSRATRWPVRRTATASTCGGAWPGA